MSAAAAERLIMNSLSHQCSDGPTLQQEGYRWWIGHSSLQRLESRYKTVLLGLSARILPGPPHRMGGGRTRGSTSYLAGPSQRARSWWPWVGFWTRDGVASRGTCGQSQQARFHGSGGARFLRRPYGHRPA